MPDYSSPDFGWLGELPDIYRKSRQQSALDEFGNKLTASGTPDYQALAALAAKGGQLGVGLNLLQLKRQQEASDQFNKLIPSLSGGQSPVQQSPPLPAAQAPPGGNPPPLSPSSGGAISGIESGGRYDVLGPVTKTGDRAYGKYQVMGANIPQWTQQVLGRQMTAQEFVASPEAQEAVFKAKFGEYTSKYGPEGAARAWFAGEGGMNDPNRRDQLGTSVADYSRKFMAAGGGGPQVMDVDGPSSPDAKGVYRGDAVLMPQQQTAQADPAALPPNATPTQGFSVPGQQQPSVPQTGNFNKNIGLLLGLVSNPNLDKGQREAASKLLEHTLKSSDLPEEQKNYVLYRQQGGAEDFTTWMRKNKTAGATLINTAEGLEAKQAGARIEIDRDAIKDLAKKAIAGRSALPLLEQFMRLADKTPGGWAGQASPMIARAMSGMGMPVPEGLSNAETLNTINRLMIPSIRDPGATANYEQQLYMQAAPGLAQSVEGRLKIARMFKLQIDRNNDLLKVYRTNVGKADLDEKLAELDNKPMFSPEDRKELERIAGAAQSSGAAPQQIQEGATATNKQTGQKIIFQGGQWQPVQ